MGVRQAGTERCTTAPQNKNKLNALNCTHTHEIYLFKFLNTCLSRVLSPHLES